MLRILGLSLVFLIIGVLVCTALTSCNALRPQVNAGYYIVNEPTSQATVVVGSNGTQANAIHAAVGAPGGTSGAVKSDSGGNKVETPAGLFVNAGQFEKSSDTDLSAALESLRNVKGSTAGLTQAAQASTGTSTQNPTNTTSDTTTLEIPVAVSQSAATATTGQQQPSEVSGKAGATAPGE